MSAKSIKSESGKKPASAATNLVGTARHSGRRSRFGLLTFHTAGGGAGMMEALVCHPLGNFMVQDANHARFKC